MHNIIRYTVLITSALILSACKLGGVVEGLEGTLIIQEQQSGETLELTESGPYQFKTEFDENHPYSVLIIQQPESNAKQCVIREGEGKYSKETQVNIHCQSVTMCTMEYAPVCALEGIPIQCITAPCDPLLVHKTYSNSCAANASGSEIVFEGICGDLEDKPEQIACTREYDPVCAIDTTPIVCLHHACQPERTYQTFSNACTAKSVRAEIVSNAECGDLENQTVPDAN